MLSVQYLFHQFRNELNRHATASAHQHPFWQIDRIASGNGTVLIGEQRLNFHAGDIIVLPQHIIHEFVYDPKVEHAWLSVKFSVKNADSLQFPGAIIRDHAILGPLFEAIAAALNPVGRHHEIVAEMIDAMLASAVCTLELDTSNGNMSNSQLLNKIKEYIFNHRGRCVRVAELGDALKYSEKYLSSYFLQKTGIQLKTFIDKQRCEYAAGLLQTSSASLTEIAAELEFRDIFAFSRFFKRNFGETLSGFRKRRLHDR